MALNTNYGYPSSGYSSPYSSTPSGLRTQRPRFGFSGPSMYSRYRSSASDTNTESFSDSMINNYGTSASRIDTTFNSESGSPYNGSYDTSGSNYYSANNSFSHGQSYGGTSMMHSNYSLREDGGVSRDNSMMHGYSDNYPGIRAPPHSDTPNSGPTQFDVPMHNYNSTFHMNNAAEFKGIYPKKSGFRGKNNKPYFAKNPRKPSMATTKQSNWRCNLCNLDFTSQIPHDMHFRGAKHAKKLKTTQVLTQVQAQAECKTITSEDDKKTFYCELCDVKANSSLQLQTHLDGTKHKSKLQSKESPSQPVTQEDSKVNAITSVNGKTNGSLVRALPSDFGDSQPTKIFKYACDVCNIAVNSQIQLQQHLTSKKHQNKVEGKPVTKPKRVKKDEDTADTPASDNITGETPMEQAPTETSTKVVGVKTLASSFVHGETLQ